MSQVASLVKKTKDATKRQKLFWFLQDWTHQTNVSVSRNTSHVFLVFVSKTSPPLAFPILSSAELTGPFVRSPYCKGFSKQLIAVSDHRAAVIHHPILQQQQHTKKMSLCLDFQGKVSISINTEMVLTVPDRVVRERKKGTGDSCWLFFTTSAKHGRTEESSSTTRSVVRSSYANVSVKAAGLDLDHDL